jgi:ParB family transcriptional regulator, chromosome partitioning protein
VKIQQIPLNRLVPSSANLRKTDRMAGIEELAASIKAHGLLQNLQVRAGDDGKFEVVAGMRRLAALKRLAKEKAIAKAAEIACHVLDGEDAAEISLAEPGMRLPMHPADQFEAFKVLADDGKGARRDCCPVRVQPRDRQAASQARQCQPGSCRRLPRRGDERRSIDSLHRRRRPRGAGKSMGGTRRMEPPPDTIRRISTRAHVEASDRRARLSESRRTRRQAGRYCATCSPRSMTAI